MFNDTTAFPAVAKGTTEGTISAAHYEFMQLLSSIVGSPDDAIVLATLQRQGDELEPGAERIFGYVTQKRMGRSPMRLAGSATDSDLRCRLAQVGRGEESGSYETARCCKSGKHIPVSVTMSPLRDAATGIIGVAEISRDVSDRKQALRYAYQVGQRARLHFAHHPSAMDFHGLLTRPRLDGDLLVR